MKDPKRLRELIIEKLNLASVMESYDVAFVFNPHLMDEVQFHCAFHGKDSKPSARLYNNTKSCYCWVCKKSWDVVSFIQESEKLPYVQTLQYIIDRYKIDISSIPNEPDIRKKQSKVS